MPSNPHRVHPLTAPPPACCRRGHARSKGGGACAAAAATTAADTAAAAARRRRGYRSPPPQALRLPPATATGAGCHHGLANTVAERRRAGHGHEAAARAVPTAALPRRPPGRPWTASATAAAVTLQGQPAGGALAARVLRRQGKYGRIRVESKQEIQTRGTSPTNPDKMEAAAHHALRPPLLTHAPRHRSRLSACSSIVVDRKSPPRLPPAALMASKSRSPTV